MPDSAATVQLKRMTAWDTDPALTQAEIDALVVAAARRDKYGLWPADTGWLATYDLNAAAAEGWRWKAAKATPRVDTALDSVRYSRGQTFEHCTAMADRYAKRIVQSIPTPGRGSPYGEPDALSGDTAGY